MNNSGSLGRSTYSKRLIKGKQRRALKEMKSLAEMKTPSECLKGRVSRLCAWANCHVSPFNSIVIETIESTDAGNGNNPIVIHYSLELLL